MTLIQISVSLKAEVMSVYRQLFPLVSPCSVNLSGVEKNTNIPMYRDEELHVAVVVCC